MKILETLKKYITGIGRISGYLSYIGYALIILLTVADVILRKVANAPIVGGYEIIQYLLLVSVFASFAYCQTLRGHIQVTMFLRVFPKRVVFLLYALGGLLSTVVMLAVSYAAAQQAIYAMEKGFLSDTLHFVTYPFIWLECICMAVFGLTCLLDVIYSVAALFKEDLRNQLYEEWI